MSEVNMPISLSWIEKGDHDQGVARITYQHLPAYYDMIAFHCQQAVEKYLKAALVYLDIDFPRSHDLIYLLDLLSGKIEIGREKYDKAILLNGYSVEVRYPNKVIFLTDDELQKALSITGEFRTFVEHIIGLNKPNDEEKKE